MAIINEQFIRVKIKANFESRLSAGDIKDTSIAFIEDTNEIWAKGHYYPCSYSATDITNLLNNKVDKESGKSLVSDELITKLEGLDNQDAIDAAIEAVKNTVDGYTVNGHKISENPVLTKADIGLGNVTNEAQIPLTQKGANNGVATLDESGKVPSTQLPSFVDDVLEYDNFEAFPGTGESGKIYVAKDVNLEYRWSGTQYIQISKSIGLGETSSTAYSGDKGKQVADRVAEVYSANSVINGLSDITFDSDDTGAQTLSADNALKAWDGNGTLHDMKIPYATTSKAGVMSAADKQKLDNIESEIGQGSTVEVTQVVTSGTHIATVTIDDVDTNIYAPEYETPTVTWDSITDKTVATNTQDGLMSSEDKVKLDRFDYVIFNIKDFGGTYLTIESTPLTNHTVSTQQWYDTLTSSDWSTTLFINLGDADASNGGVVCPTNIIHADGASVCIWFCFQVNNVVKEVIINLTSTQYQITVNQLLRSVTVTQDQYNSIENKDSNTLYFITSTIETEYTKRFNFSKDVFFTDALTQGVQSTPLEVTMVESTYDELIKYNQFMIDFSKGYQLSNTVDGILNFTLCYISEDYRQYSSMAGNSLIILKVYDDLTANFDYTTV